MKVDVRNRNSDLMIYELQDIMVSIESLNEYYLNSISTIQKMKLVIEEEYKIGLLVYDGIQKALSAENLEEAKQFIEKMNLQKMSDGKKLSDYIIVECDIKEKELSFSYSIKEKSGIKSKYVDPQKARREYEKIGQYENILISSTLSNVIIIFEQYLARVYKGLILINPKKYFQNQKIEIASIFNKSVKDIVVECVNNEVESNMFDSLKTLELISEKEGLDINRFRNIKDEFEEIYYRRNLYIHSVYEEAGDVERQIEQAKRILLLGNEEFWDVLKRLCLRKNIWEEQKAILLEELKNSKYMVCYRSVLIEENEKELLLEAITDKPFDLFYYGQFLVKVYPDEIFALCKDYIREKCAEATDRRLYKKVCKELLQLIKWKGSMIAKELIEEFREKYPRKTALLDELQKVEKKL